MIELYRWQCYYKKRDSKSFEPDYCTNHESFNYNGPARMQCIEMHVLGQDDLEVRGKFEMILDPELDYNNL